MKHGKHINEPQLLKLGFREISPGKWGKNDSENHAARSSVAVVEPNTGRPAQKKAKNQSRRKNTHPNGNRYRLVITSYRTSLIDSSNPYYKSIEDTLTKNEIFPDDGPEYCDQPIFVQHKVPKELERTDVEVLRY